jgi:uncharacterized repeat protein (TIGR01451 family)
MKTPERERHGWILVAVLLLLGLLCVLMAGNWAIRFSPSWRLVADMGSGLDPNRGYLTRPAENLVPPLDPAILTQPVWIDFFLTPGAVVPTRIPVSQTPQIPASTSTQAGPATQISLPTASPTGTIVFFPATRTPTAKSTVTKKSTLTNPPASTPLTTKSPAQTADLQVTKDDGTSTYAANGTLTYTVAVVNHGPGNVTGAIVTDNIPTQVTGWNWICSSQTGGASGCNGMNGNSNFSDTVSLPAGAGITYTVTANISAAASGDLTNTASVKLPAGITDPAPANNQSSDVDSPAVDLQITKSDNAGTYTAGSTLTYMLVVTNNSTFDVNGAVVTDLLPSQIDSATWSCVPAGAGVCTPNGTGNINDTVNIPAGLSITYSLQATVSTFAMGTLTNTASVTAPAGFIDTAPGNNSAADSNAPASTEPDIGPPDSFWISIPQGTSMTLMLSPAIVADGDNGTPDFVYFERLATPTYIEMDWVRVEISSDGSTWYQVFYWGDTDGLPDTNTNLDVQNLISDLCPTEIDNCHIPPARLYSSSGISTGITVDIDPFVPPGNYPWLRITSPPSSDASEVDAIQPYYP